MRMSVTKGIVGALILLLFGIPIVAAVDDATGTGYIGIKIESTNQIAVYTDQNATNSTLEFKNTTIPPEGLNLSSSNLGDMSTYVEQKTGFVIENQGNINVTITVQANETAGDKTHDGFLGYSTSPVFEYWAEQAVANSCDTLQPDNTSFSTSPTDVCKGPGGLNYVDGSDTIHCYIHIYIPSDTPPGQKSATLTFTSTAVV